MEDLEIRQMPITCDFCAHPGTPTWRYDLPPGTTLIATYDPKTRILEETKAHSGMGACDLCDKILRVGILVPTRIAKRMMKLEPFQSMTKEQRARSRRGWAKQLKRLVPLLRNRRPNVQGEDPMDGLGLFSQETIEHD